MAAAPIQTTGAPAASTIAPGVIFRVELSGAIPSYVPTNIFREKLIQQLQLRGLDVDRIEVTGGYGITSRDYSAVCWVKTHVRMDARAVISTVKSAAEGAGSYTPTASIPDVGMIAQPTIAPGPIDALANALVTVGQSVGTAAKNVAEAPKDLKDVILWVSLGIVVIVGLVAFGPNIGGIAKAATRR